MAGSSTSSGLSRQSWLAPERAGHACAAPTSLSCTTTQPSPPFRLELGISVDAAAGANQQCRATSHSASHCSLSTSLSLLLSERSAYIQKKKNPDRSFSSTPFRHGHEMFLFQRKRLAAFFFFFWHLCYKSRCTVQQFRGVRPSRILPPDQDQEQLSAARHKVTDAPLERHKLQKVSASLRHRV